MRIEMPDGTAVILAYHEDGVVLATQARRQRGKLPPPSGILVTGDTADLIGALIDALDEADAEAVLGQSTPR